VFAKIVVVTEALNTQQSHMCSVGGVKVLRTGTACSSARTVSRSSLSAIVLNRWAFPNRT
jgi:hypothetical protein